MEAITLAPVRLLQHEWGTSGVWLPNIWGHSQDWIAVRKPIHVLPFQVSENGRPSVAPRKRMRPSMGRRARVSW
jgi:hypothetical protein